MAHALIGLLFLGFWTISAFSAPQVSSPTAVIGQFMGCGAVAGKIPKTDASGIAQCSDDAGAGTGAPTTAPYVTTTPDGTLTNEQALSPLASCLLANTTGTGILSCYGGSGSVANQFLRSMNLLGVGTFSQVALADLGFDPATQLEFDAHLNDTTDAHAASAIQFTPAGGIAAGNAQAAIVEALTDAAALVTAHEGDATAAHAASAVSFAPNGSLAATTVQAAVQEVRDEAPRLGGTSDCTLDGEIYKRVGGLWACTPDASGGAGGSPGGANTQVQFNNAGAFGGDAGLTYNAATDVLTAVGGFAGPLVGPVTCTGCIEIGELAFDPATQLEFDAHANDTTGIHGIADTTLLALTTDARFPTANEKAALVGTSGTATSGTNKLVDHADNRLAAVQTPAALSAASQINCDKPTQIITGSAPGITLSNAKWLTDGDFPGQTCELFNPSATNTVIGPTTATIINCGGTGSVVIALNQETPKYTWTGSVWQLGGCINAQHALNAGPKVLAGLTTAAPLQLRGGTADAASTTGVNGYDNGAGAWIWQGVCAGGTCDTIDRIQAGKIREVRNSADVALQTIAETTGAHTNVKLNVEGIGNDFTTYEEQDYNAAGCENVTAGHIWDVPATDAPTATCDPAATNSKRGYLAFNDSTDQAVFQRFRLPTGYIPGSIDWIFDWKSAAITGFVGWCVQLARVADGMTSDQAFPAQAAGNCVSDQTKGTPLQTNAATITGATCTACAGGDWIEARISRDANGGAVTDSLIGNAFLLGWTKRVRMIK